jgi:hypothetical protein
VERVGDLESELEVIELTSEEDSVRWALTPHGQFTTSSLYRHWTFPWVRDLMMEVLCHSKLPLKIKNFVWLVHKDRVQTADNLGRKQWRGSKFCQFRQDEESVDHLIFKCPIVVFVWAVLRDGLKWRRIPKSVGDFKENFLLCKGPKGVRIVWFLFGTVSWTLWLNRDDFIFNDRTVSSPRARIFQLISFLQHWIVVASGADRTALEQMVKELKSQVPEELAMTGVG